MKPYYEEAGIKIFHGDCRDLLPVVTGDLLLTDPPYGVGGGSGTIGLQRSGKHSYAEFDDSRESVVREVVPRFIDYLTVIPRAILTPGPLCCNAYPQPDSFGVFYQPASVGLQKWGRGDAQPIFYYGRDPLVGKRILSCSRRLTETPKPNGHPCPKPLDAWQWLLDKGSLPGETVVDPFMGSGTTLVAAKKLGRNAVGVELEERYCEIAAKRLAQGVLAL